MGGGLDVGEPDGLGAGPFERLSVPPGEDLQRQPPYPYLTPRISYDRSPPGAGTETVSPTALPISALASGEEMLSSDCLMSASCHADDLVARFLVRLLID